VFAMTGISVRIAGIGVQIGSESVFALGRYAQLIMLRWSPSIAVDTDHWGVVKSL